MVSGGLSGGVILWQCARVIRCRGHLFEGEGNREAREVRLIARVGVVFYWGPRVSPSAPWLSPSVFRRSSGCMLIAGFSLGRLRHVRAGGVAIVRDSMLVQ